MSSPNRGRSGITRPMGGSFGSADSLSRTKSNPKYQNVKSHLAGRTGSHAKNTKIKVDRRYELFKRLGRTTLASLMKKRYDDAESIYNTAASDVLSVTTIGDADELKIKAELAETDFILCDMRTQEAYETCHIDGAIMFLPMMLKTDRIPKEVVAFKARAQKIIVIYVEHEGKLGKELATMLNGKGYTNVHLLTGGIQYFAEKFGFLLTGDIPEEYNVEAGEEYWSEQLSGPGRASPRAQLGVHSPGSSRGSPGSRASGSPPPMRF